MAHLWLFAMEEDKTVEQPNQTDRPEKIVANMDETDWMAMLMEMRVISA